MHELIERAADKDGLSVSDWVAARLKAAADAALKLPHAGDDGWNAAIEAAATKAAISVQYFRDTAVGNGLSVREARCAKNACADLERAIRRLALPTPPAKGTPHV